MYHRSSLAIHTDCFDQLQRSQIRKHGCGYSKLEYLLGYYEGTYAEATGIEATTHAVAAEYLYSTLNSTLTCSSHSRTVLYEIHLAGQEESGCAHSFAIMGEFGCQFFW